MDQFVEMSVAQDETDTEGKTVLNHREENTRSLSTSITTRSNPEEESNLGTFHRLRNCSKPHSTPLTLKWLEENYEIAEGVCIPRSTLYYHYLNHCEATDTQPVNAASFGKIIRQQFPQITTRRLGTRGQSKYHYYGIGVIESSKYYEVMYSAKGSNNIAESKKENAKTVVAYSPRSKLGTLLPDFPDVQEIKLPENIAEDKVVTFMMMYRTHCQRILDTVIRANFDEVQNFLLHFWQGMPDHMTSILDTRTIVMLVGVCDSILYKAIANVLMPTVLQALPESLTQVIRRFAKQLDGWLKIALDSLPSGIQRIKFDLARRFAHVLRRQSSLNHLCQTARTVIHNGDISAQMLEDWISVDLNSIIKQTMYIMDSNNQKHHQMIIDICNEFEQLLEDQAPLQSYIEWLDDLVDRCVVQMSSKKTGTLRRVARQFLLMWSCFGTRVIRDMTLHSAPSFGSFHLLHLMFDDYVLYLVENLYNQERSDDFLRNVKGELKDVCEDDILPDSSIIKAAFLAAHTDEPTNKSTCEKDRLANDPVVSCNIENPSVVKDRSIDRKRTENYVHDVPMPQKYPNVQAHNIESLNQTNQFSSPNTQTTVPELNNEEMYAGRNSMEYQLLASPCVYNTQSSNVPCSETQQMSDTMRYNSVYDQWTDAVNLQYSNLHSETEYGNSSTAKCYNYNLYGYYDQTDARDMASPAGVFHKISDYKNDDSYYGFKTGKWKI